MFYRSLCYLSVNTSTHLCTCRNENDCFLFHLILKISHIEKFFKTSYRCLFCYTYWVSYHWKRERFPMQQHLSYKPSGAPEEGLNLKTFLGTPYLRSLQAVCSPFIFPSLTKLLYAPDKYLYN